MPPKNAFKKKDQNQPYGYHNHNIVNCNYPKKNTNSLHKNNPIVIGFLNKMLRGIKKVV